MAGRDHIRALLRPESVAVIGASKDPRKPGHVLLRNIRDGRFAGRLYAINPSASEIAGQPCFPSIANVPELVDQAVIVLRRERVLQAVESCASVGVKAIVIVTAGFGEADEWGRREEAKLRELAVERGLAVIGPNTIGLVTMGGDYRGSFVPFLGWTDGPTAIVAQTGIYAGAVALEMMMQSSQRLGIHVSIDIGNRVSVDELELLEVLAADRQIEVLGFYLESFANGRAFLRLAAEVKRSKPIVVLKPGRTMEGAKASMSHTGSLAEDDSVVDQLLGEHGLIRAADEEEFLSILKAFSFAPLPRGDRVAVVTYSGALGVMATDQLLSRGLEIATLDADTTKRIKGILPDWQTVRNPVDLWAGVDADPAETLRVGFSSVLADPNVDQVLGLLLAVPPADFQGFRQSLAEIRHGAGDKPLHLVMAGGLRQYWTDAVDGLGVPVHSSIRQAARAMGAATEYVQRRHLLPSAHMESE
jgi:acyl-CoA synthetase (NDP forming)